MMGPEAMGLTVVNFGWEDERACRNFLCGTCPHILFTNTKMDLGICPKSHTERLRTEYLAAVAANPNDPVVLGVQVSSQSPGRSSLACLHCLL